MLRKVLVTVIIAALVFGCIAGCAEKDSIGENTKSGEQVHITIGTASVGGVFYPVGMTLAKIWNQEVPNVKAVSIATAGSPQNLDMLRTNDIEVAICRQLEAYRALKGIETYKEAMPWVRSISGGLFYDAKQILALNDRGIESIADFKGKKVAVGPVGSGGEIDAREILAAFGLTYNDVTPEYVEASQAVDMMKDGLLDGAILGLTMGSSAVSELMLTGKIKLLPIEDFAFEKLKEKEPWMQRRIIPKNVYPKQDYEVVTTGSPPDIIVTREDMPEDLVYNLTKSLYENDEEMKKVAQVMEQFGTDLVRPEDEMLIPYHPGAKRYFKEIGILE